MAAIEQRDQERERDLAQVGIFTGEEGEERSGTYVLENFHASCVLGQTEGLELMPIAEALEKYPWFAEKYYWNAVPSDLDEVTARLARDSEPQGYMARVAPGAKVRFPCQTGLYMTEDRIAQTVHNVIILEEGAELEIITGCVASLRVEGGYHLAVTEAYIGKNARLTNTMIHSWGQDMEIKPRAGTIVEEGGDYTSNYVSLRPARDMRMNPRVWLNGPGASYRYNGIILGSGHAHIDTGGEVYLNAEDTSAEMVHRAVSTGGEVYQRGLLVGSARCRAHIDCAGIILDPDNPGLIRSIPGIQALHPDVQMSHEASLGRVAAEQVEYLQTRGLTEAQATAMIIRGFVAADIAGLGSELDERIAEITALAGHGEG